MTLKDKIDIAAGRKKAELVLKNGHVVNVFTQEIVKADVAIGEDTILAVGSYAGETEVDVTGKMIVPGFIDGHVHIESSMVTPSRFAEAVLPCGTTAVIADPHEIANVCGADGIRFMIEDGRNVPLDIHIMLPSCVPAASFEESGASLDADAIRALFGLPGVLGLGELMDYPGVVAGDPDILQKIRAAGGRVIDGHAPRLTGKELAGYVIGGPKTDHECGSIEEMREKLRLGMVIHIRNGSACREIRHLVKGVNAQNMRRTMFCTDDRHPHDILQYGHINSALKTAVENGLDPVTAVIMATLNPAECYGLKQSGAVAPGYKADLVVLDDLKDFKVSQVYKNGKLAAQDGKALFESRPAENRGVTGTVRLDPVTEDDLKIPLGSGRVNVILPVPGRVETRKAERNAEVKDGCFAFSKDGDICKAAVFERHKRLGHIGLGLIAGFGIKDGAIAQTIAHDSHNIIAAGDNDRDIVIAVNALAKGKNGGIVLAHNGEIVNHFELPVAGLMSLRPLRETAEIMAELEKTATEVLRMDPSNNPLMALGFLALPVIPELRVTTQGLFDAVKFQLIDIECNAL